MKKKSIIISIIVILILIVVGLFIINLPKEHPIEPMPTVELIEEETIVEETNTDKSDPSIPEFNFKQGTVEGYVSETPAEQEVITGEEISLEEVPDEVQEAMDEIDKALSDTQKPAGVSSYAGTTSKHNWDYPDDYVENGGRFIDRRGDIERKFDKGWIDETDYQERLEDLEQQQGDADDYASTGLGSGSMKGLAESIAESGQEATGEDGSTIPGGGGDPIIVPEGNTYHPDGILCY